MELEELVDLPENIFASDPAEDIFDLVPPEDIFESVEGIEEVEPPDSLEEDDPSEDFDLLDEAVLPEDIALIEQSIPPGGIDFFEEIIAPGEFEEPEPEPEHEPKSEAEPEAKAKAEAKVDLPSDSVTTIAKEPTEGEWRVRVCPILWEDFSRLRKEFVAVLKLSTFLEFRMSQHLATRLDPVLKDQVYEDRYVPWLPNEKIFIKPKNCASAGLLEFKVLDAHLVEVMTVIRSADLTKRNRLRIELKREILTSQPAETKTGGEGETKEGEKEAGGEKIVAPQTIPSPADNMLVNFAVRLKPVKEPAFSHEPGYKLQPKDEQIFLKRVPGYVPDYVIKAIMLAEMLERQKTEDSTSDMTFHVTSPLGAHGYMELFDGILINNKDIEMSTTLGSLYDSKKQHSEKEKQNRETNEKLGVKRPYPGWDGGSADFPMSKKARLDEGEKDDDGEELSPIALVWLRGQQSLTRGGLPKLMSGRLAMQHRILALRDQGVYVGPSAVVRGRGRSWIRGGRGAPRGRGTPFRGRGGAGAPPGRGGGGGGGAGPPGSGSPGEGRGGGPPYRGGGMGPRGGPPPPYHRGRGGPPPPHGRGGPPYGRGGGPPPPFGREPPHGMEEGGPPPPPFGDGRGWGPPGRGRGGMRGRGFVRGGWRGPSPGRDGGRGGGGPPFRGGGPPFRGGPPHPPPHRDSSPRAGEGYAGGGDLHARLAATERELQKLKEEALGRTNFQDRRRGGFSPRGGRPFNHGFSPRNGDNFYNEGHGDRFDEGYGPPHRRKW